MSLEASCDTCDTYPVSKRLHRLAKSLAKSTPLPPPEDSDLVTTLPLQATTPLPRKSGKNVFSKHLRQVNTQLFRLNGKGAKVTTELPPSLTATTSLHFDRLVLKLVPRELTKFMQLLEYFATDPYYDSVDAIVSFTRESYIARRNIHRDDEYTQLSRGPKTPPPDQVSDDIEVVTESTSLATSSPPLKVVPE